MNSVDDSAVVTPADTSNLSSPDSTSSEFSQPTVKLRTTNDPKKRQNQKDTTRIFTADGHDPFIQNLDKDGRHLVEKTGRTAQRTRMSIRDSSRWNKKLNELGQAEKSKTSEYSWPHYYHQPIKSHSSTNASSLERNANRRVRKRHSYGAETSRKSWDKSEYKETPKRYSAGDYLRQQILEDLNSNEIVGKTDQQIAEDRCNRIKAYLRRRTDDYPYVEPETRLREIRDWSKFGCKDFNNFTKAKRRKDLDRIRNYLQEKIRMKMNEEELRNSEMKKCSEKFPNELTLQDIKTRFSDYKVNDKGNYYTRRVRSDVNVRRQQFSSSDSELDNKKMVNTLFGNGNNGYGKKANTCRRTKSDIVPEMIIDYDDNEVKTRFYSFLGSRRNSWKTKSGLTFEKKLSLPDKTSKYLDCENDESTNDDKRYDRKSNEIIDDRNDFIKRDKDFKKYCRRTRSDNVKSKLIESTNSGKKSKKRSVSWSDRRKLLRKTSEKSAHFLESTSVDSEVDSTNIRRGKNQIKNSPCSWREYKEKRRQDQLRKELANSEKAEGFEKICSTPEAWKKFQQNCPSSEKTLENEQIKKLQEPKYPELLNSEEAESFDKICSTPESWTNFRQNCPSSEKSLNNGKTEKLQKQQYSDQSEFDTIVSDYKIDDPTKTNEMTIESTRSSENANDTETETILQENYLLLERDENLIDSNYRSPTISRLQVNEYRDEADLINYEANNLDFGYDTIMKNSKIQDFEKSERIEFNVKSNVKKSDTFKIIDGSEKSVDNEFENEIGMTNYDKNQKFRNSNESKNLLFAGKIINKFDDVAQVDGSENSVDNQFQNEIEMTSYDENQKSKNFSFACNLINNFDDVAQVDDTITTSQHSEGDDAIAFGAGDDAFALSNKDIARDYFRRVYELLKQRQENARRETPQELAVTRYDSDSSSTNYDELEELRKRRRRRKKDKGYQGEELVAVSPGVGEDDGWGVQRILANDDPENLIFRRPQLQNPTGHKRQRNPAPPIPANCRINAKDISKYFDYPNKENSPRNGVDENGRSKRNELIEQHQQLDSNEAAMGSNLSRHNGKGLTGRRTQSSGNLCDPKGKLNHVGKILVPCSSNQRERYKICSSLPNHLDDKEILDDDDPRENNNTISDNMGGNFGGTLPHKKRSLGVHFSDSSPTGTLDLVKHRSQDSLEGDPWRYQEGVDLDLVRCKHGNFDVVRKNANVDVVDGDGSSNNKTYGTLGRSSDGKCFRGADLDLVGTLPKRRPPAELRSTSGLRQSFEARQNRQLERMDSSDLLIKVMHKPDCELMKHHQFERVVDLKLSRLAGGEPQDQGYASERSPEDEHPPSLPGQPFPKVTPENTFRVTLQKSSRGLGLSVSGGGTAGPVRVKRLFPQQPAALSKKLQSGDILLAANGVPLTGLTNYEALEVLRTTPSTVELVVCRVPGDTSVTSPGAPPPPPARREPPSSLRILNPQPPLHIEPCGEFDIEMTKVAGSLGFTLRKVDSSALGHYVRALVREPALSDGRIQPGDKIVSVDGEPLSPMSHEEAVALLRQCGPRVKLRLYRDLAQTPVSALSPTEPDHPLRPPRTSLRQEAVDMLCDLAVRKLSPDTSNGANSRQTSAASCHSPRRLRKPLARTPTADNDPETHLTFHPVHPPTTTSHTDVSDTDQCSINTQATNSQSEMPANDIIDPPPLYDVCESSDSSKNLSRPSFLDLTARPEKPHFRFSLESESDYTGPIVVTESDSNLTAECEYDQDLEKDQPALSSDEPDNNLPSEPASMPPLLSTTRTTSAAFSYKNPAYQSANPTCGGIDNSAKNKIVHSSDHDIPGKVLGAEDPAGSKGLLKWKGVMFAPNDEVEKTNEKPETEETEKESTTEVSTRNPVSEDGNEVFTVELTRGWNSRLGFSLQPEGNSTVISVVHPDSVAAKDGRLQEGDVLIMVNDESIENMPTAEIIDLLRKIRGSIGITVIRKSKRKNVS